MVAALSEALWETVYRLNQPGNYGWPIREGSFCYDRQNPLDPPDSCPNAGASGWSIHNPVIQYPNLNIAEFPIDREALGTAMLVEKCIGVKSSRSWDADNTGTENGSAQAGGTSIVDANSDADGADPPAAASTSGVYTAAQVERGRGLYQTNCQSCHAQNMKGSSPFPPITGQVFFSSWGGEPVSALQQYVRDNRPLGEAGSLSDQTYAAIISYWLLRHGYPEVGQPLPKNPDNWPDLPLEDRRD